MNSKELFNKLETLNDDDIELMISMSIRYLEKNRGFSFKDILNGIKVYHKVLERRL